MVLLRLAFDPTIRNNGKVIIVNEPQVWTVIGVLAASLFGGLTVITQLILRTVQAEIGTVRAEIGSLRTEMRTEVGSLHGEVGSLRTEVGSLRTEVGSLRTEVGALRAVTETKFESLDRDIQGLARHVFGSSTPE